MAFLIFSAAAAVPFAGLAVWRLFIRTGHRGGAALGAAALAVGGVLAALAFIFPIIFGAFGEGLVLGPVALGLMAILITAAAFWLAVKPWPGREM